MAQQNSFDIVSQVDHAEVSNAINQTLKEVRQRFDFKGSHANVAAEEKELVLTAEDETKLRNMNDILQQKLVRRGVPLKALSYGEVEPAAGGTVRQRVQIQQGIPQEKAKDIVKLIKDSKATELLFVEAEFERQARSNIQVIAYIGDYLRRSGGKRVRPALTILANHAVGGDGSNQSSIRMATVMEFLHTATLVHDDVIDRAETRRNRPSINSEFCNQTAVLMGDWLYMSAFETSLTERSLAILDILTAVTRKMTE